MADEEASPTRVKNAVEADNRDETRKAQAEPKKMNISESGGKLIKP